MVIIIGYTMYLGFSKKEGRGGVILIRTGNLLAHERKNLDLNNVPVFTFDLEYYENDLLEGGNFGLCKRNQERVPHLLRIIQDPKVSAVFSHVLSQLFVVIHSVHV